MKNLEKAIQEATDFIREATLYYFEQLDLDVDLDSVLRLDTLTDPYHDLQTMLPWDEFYHPSGMTVREKINDLNEKYDVDLEEDTHLQLTKAEENAAIESYDRVLAKYGKEIDWDHVNANGWLVKDIEDCH